MARTTVYALQEFFIGEWDDYRVIADKGKAERAYRTFRNVHYRPTRLIERTETLLAEGKENEE
jgi:hypothetical protein